MLDRLLTWWLPIAFVLLLLSLVLPRTSGPILRLTAEWLYR